MFSSILPNGISSKSHLSHPKPRFPHIPIRCGIRELRERIASVKNTEKITEAMKLVAAARVRRAQEAVINGRPFSQTLAQVLHDINLRLQNDDVEVPLTAVRPVKTVALVVITGDRGLCGGFNNAVLKKAESRIHQLKKLGLRCVVISVGKKGDEFFRLTSKDGKLTLKRDIVGIKEKNKKNDGVVPIMEFEQDPAQILDAMMPLYLNSQILRALQESLASELAARMGAMSNATDNAVELRKNLGMAYNRERQAKITGEILEIVAGAEALRPID